METQTTTAKVPSKTTESAVPMTLNERQADVTKIAVWAGLEGALATAAVSFPATYMVHRYYPPFTTRLNVSARTAIIITPPVFAFALVSEQVASRLANPRAFESYLKDTEEHSKLAPHKRLANYFYFHPFKCVVFLSVPAVAGIFLTRDAAHLKFSQRVMHTRVLGQASILAILASTMYFHDFMEKRGPFTE